MLESLKLRDYSKNLLNALKLQQLNINKSVNEISKKNNEFNPLELNNLISNISNFKTNVDAAANTTVESTGGVGAQKSVSFSEKLVASPRRRAKSVPPKLLNPRKPSPGKKSSRKQKKKKTPRSILKRFQQISIDTTDTDSMDEETKSLYNEINDFYLKNNEYSINIRDINRNDKQSMIQCLTKSRQKYLNHDYNDSTNDSSNIDFEELRKIRDTSSKKSTTIKINNDKNAAKLSNENKSRSRKNIIRKNLKVNDKDLKSLSDSEENKKVVKHKQSTTFSIKNIPKNNKTLLGYDWIKDALENGKNVSFNQSDEYWNDLISFRNQNKNDCVSREVFNENSTINDHYDSMHQDDDPENLRHKCIHTYTINERLFAVPTYVGDNGESICPVCKSSRKEPTSYAPQFCKISIPQSRLHESEVKIIPQKRSQYEREDTLSLSEHCVAGFGNLNENLGLKSQRAKNVDLKSATGRSCDVVKFTIDDVKKIASNKDPTASLYNKGHAMRFELENQHQKRLRELVPKMKIK